MVVRLNMFKHTRHVSSHCSVFFKAEIMSDQTKKQLSMLMIINSTKYWLSKPSSSINIPNFIHLQSSKTSIIYRRNLDFYLVICKALYPISASDVGGGVQKPFLSVNNIVKFYLNIINHHSICKPNLKEMQTTLPLH